MRKLVMLALCALLLPPAYAHTPEDPAMLMPAPFEDWQTLDTPNFRINYQPRHLEFAQRLAAIAEQVHARLTPWLQWTPDDKTEVVISDTYDGSNGGASVMPYNRFFIFMNAPTDGELLDNGDWIEQVFTHEYVHILHLDQADGLPSGLRNVFGRIFFNFPQAFSPLWITEGIAVKGETDAQKGFGRGQSALYDAMMRAEYSKGFRTYSQTSYQGYWGTDWPSGQVYLYGYYFFEFLEQRHGHEKAMAYLKNWNSNLIPWRMNSRAQDTFNISAEALWQQYIDYLNEKFSAQVKQIPAGEQTAVVSDGRINTNPEWLPGGDFYYYRNDGRNKPSLQRIDAQGVETRVAKVDRFVQFDVHPRAGVLLAREDVCDNRKVYTDLYRLKDNGRWRRITHCGRYPSIAWSTSGEQIAAVHVQGGQNQIALLDGEGELQQLLKALPAGDTIGQIAWSPDDRQLVAAIRRRASGWNLELLDLATGNWRPLTANSDLDQQPRFSADGKSVYFISDQNHLWNVRRLDMVSGRVETVSHTQTAIVDYALDETTAQMRVAEYTADGVMLRQQKILPQQTVYAAVTAQPAALPTIVNQTGFNPDQYSDSTDYSALSTIAPHGWFALLYADTQDNTALQFLVNGQDVLGYHFWQLAPTFYLDKDKVGGSAAYIAFHRLALLWDSTVDVEVEAEPGVLEQWDTETRYQAVWMQPFNSFDGTFRIDTGVGTENVVREMENYGEIADFNDNFGGIALSWADYDNYLHSISVEDGRWIKLNYEKYNLLGGAYHEGEAKTLDWREYISLINNHVLAIRAVAGRAGDDTKPYELGNELDQFESMGGNIGFGKTGYTLRGYNDGYDELSGTNLRLYSAEWRFPLLELFDGFTTFPLGIGKAAMHLFVDHGAAWDKSEGHHYYTGAGFELKPDLLVGYSTFKLDSTIGFAKGLDEDIGETTVYLRLGASF